MDVTIFYSFVIWALGGVFLFQMIAFFLGYSDKKILIFKRFSVSTNKVSEYYFYILSLLFLLQYNGNYFAALIFFMLIAFLISRFVSNKVKFNKFFPLCFFILFYIFFKKMNIHLAASSYLLLAVSMDLNYIGRSWKRGIVFIFRQGHFLKSMMGPIGRIRDHHRVAVDVQRSSRYILIGIIKLFILLPLFKQFMPLDFVQFTWVPLQVFFKGLWNYVVLYLEFSGFSEIVIGVFLYFGRSCPQNFSRPYLSMSLKDFWNSWHMSLGTFIRKHIYIPLGGNRHGEVRALVNLCAAMTLCGLWHGIQWNFALWGLLQGVGLALERVLRLEQRIIWSPFRWVITQLFVTFSWALFFSAF